MFVRIDPSFEQLAFRGATISHVMTVGLVPWSAATIALVESIGIDDYEKNQLSPLVVYSGNASDLLRLAHPGMKGQVARAANGEVAAWNYASRLNPARAAATARATLASPRPAPT